MTEPQITVEFPGAREYLLANRLREARKEAGLSTTRAAERIGLHRTALVDIEYHRRRVAAVELRNLARLYGRSLTWLLGDDNPATEAGEVEAALATLDSASRRSVLLYARFLLHEHEQHPTLEGAPHGR